MAIINKSKVRAKAIAYARENRFHFREVERVAESFYNSIEAEVHEAIKRRIDNLPSKGRSLT